MTTKWSYKAASSVWRNKKFRKGICLVLGQVDTGKTTLVRQLLEKALPATKTALVDADMGQSRIGPPTTVGWAIIENPEVPFESIKPGGLAFVGNTMPVNYMLQTLAAIKQSVDQAAKQAELVIIDTPGYVETAPAQALWWSVYQLVKPDTILAVARENELEPILEPLQSFNCYIKTVHPSDEIGQKSKEKRSRYRYERFMRYFAKSKRCDIDLNKVGIQYHGSQGMDNIEDRIISIRDRTGCDTAIAYVLGYHRRKKILTIQCPPIDRRRIRAIVIGDAKLPRGEQQL